MDSPNNLRALWVMLFGDYFGRYLSFNDWVVFTVRRAVFKEIINAISYIVLFIPGISFLVMPMLGLLQVWNMVDF